MASIRKSRGNPGAFTKPQNRSLRAALIELHAQRNSSQKEIGELLEIKQQNVGRLLNADGAGFSYQTATRLVRALGYASVDTFFRAKEVSMPSEGPPRAKSA